MTETRELRLRETGRLFIGGEWVRPIHGEALDVVDPATEQVVARVAQAGIADVERAVTAARAAFDHGPWPRMAPAERAGRLRIVADRLRTRLPDLARAITLEMGATLRVSTGSCAVPRCCSISMRISSRICPRSSRATGRRARPIR